MITVFNEAERGGPTADVATEAGGSGAGAGAGAETTTGEGGSCPPAAQPASTKQRTAITKDAKSSL